MIPKDPSACSDRLEIDPATTGNSVFKRIHSGERFRKASFSVIENAVSVWTLTQTDKKRCMFKNIQIIVVGVASKKNLRSH